MKKHKKLIITIIVIGLVVALGLWISSCAKQTTKLLANMNNSAKTAVVEERDLVDSVTASGTITSLSSRSLTTTLTGIKVEKVNVALGDKVSKDDIICILDDSDLEEKLEDAQYSQSNSNKLASIESGSVNRSLKDSIESQQIEVGRANDKVEKAQEKLKSFQNKAGDAYNKYADAHNKTVEAYNNVEQATADNEALKNRILTIKEDMDGYSASFDSTKSDLLDYLERLSANGHEVNISIVSSLSMGQASSLPLKSIYSGDNEKASGTIKEYVKSLRSIETKYAEKNQKMAELKPQYDAGKTTIQTLNKAYEELQKAESALWSAYEAQAEALSPYEEALEQSKQLRDDTVRSTNQAIAARKDSVATTSINADSTKRNTQNSVETIEEQITDCQVKAPVDGIVTSIGVVEGESYLGGAIVTIEDTSSLEVTAYIDEYDISKIKVGQKVIIKTNATGDEKLEGSIKTVSPRAEKGLGSVQYKVVISVLTPNDDLRLDMTAKLEIVISEKTNVLSVPYDAIQVDEKGDFYVDVLDSGTPVDFSGLTDGTMSREDIKKYQKSDTTYETHKVYITKGMESDYYVEIFSNELKPGDTIVIPANDLFSNIGVYMDESGATGGF